MNLVKLTLHIATSVASCDLAWPHLRHLCPKSQCPGHTLFWSHRSFFYQRTPLLARPLAWTCLPLIVYCSMPFLGLALSSQPTSWTAMDGFVAFSPWSLSPSSIFLFMDLFLGFPVSRIISSSLTWVHPNAYYETQHMFNRCCWGDGGMG